MGRVIVLFLLFFPVWSGALAQVLRYKLKRSQTVYVPEEVEETSGLAWYNGELITHNDSGGENRLYVLDTLGGPILRSIPVPGALNRDWEAITLDGSKLYIGDFGNNAGRRKDLTIYITDLAKLHGGLPGLDSIRFHYPGQTVFEKQNRHHDFDCEAMVVYKDTVYLYSKAWADGITKIRTLPAQPGTYATRERGGFDAGGLITDAAYDATRKRLVWVGYSFENQIIKPFVWIFETAHPGKPVNGTRIDLNPDFTQMEGVAILPSGKLAITAEGIANKWIDIAPALFWVWPHDLLGNVGKENE